MTQREAGSICSTRAFGWDTANGPAIDPECRGERQMERGATGKSAGSPLGPAPKVTSHSLPAEKILGDMKLSCASPSSRDTVLGEVLERAPRRRLQLQRMCPRTPTGSLLTFCSFQPLQVDPRSRRVMRCLKPIPDAFLFLTAVGTAESGGDVKLMLSWRSGWMTLDGHGATEGDSGYQLWRRDTGRSSWSQNMPPKLYKGPRFKEERSSNGIRLRISLGVLE
ncbi:hypothetical protein Q8A67_019061 [Cirrhinus molitorella]|uniref:Uncharacterized protein n=1 Tax=Cirrhinus molitorella TaxID=172907 RepID=A0AA88PDT7_9TELE|nr:hypothetical protein Q8A67_019061 [Cirrhinus molitorella]